jgi:hypothetical protein
LRASSLFSGCTCPVYLLLVIVTRILDRCPSDAIMHPSAITFLVTIYRSIMVPLRPLAVSMCLNIVTRFVGSSLIIESQRIQAAMRLAICSLSYWMAYGVLFISTLRLGHWWHRKVFLCAPSVFGHSWRHTHICASFSRYLVANIPSRSSVVARDHPRHYWACLGCSGRYTPAESCSDAAAFALLPSFPV